DLTMVANLYNPHMVDPHAGTAGYLAGDKGKISCDQIAAQHFNGDARYPSLVLTSKGDGSGHGKGGLSLSNTSEGNPIAGLGRPLDAYRQLFGSAGQSKEELEKMIEQKRSVLDVIASDGVDMKRRVSGEDHERIEEYFDSLRQIELGLQRQAEWSDVPLPKAPFGEPAQGLSGEEEIKMMLDLIIVALQTNSTRVATYRLPIQSLLSSLEVTISAHTLSHYSSSVTKRADSEKRDQKLMELFAYFIDRLKATKDRNGETLYDTTIASYGSNLRTGHTLKDCPALLTGGGMENIKHGRHIMLKELTPMSNYWLTILQEAGVKVNQFNDSSGPLEELFG
ncbi:DUF1552 domain-containing protein, partial [Akkermansiaceae bacterium]|nr:DUF1552 domain-containing protein [Akkermansiaceae bacterium]